LALKLPGITVRILNATGIIAPPVYERYPVIIGQGDPYRIIRNQRVVRSSGSVDNLVSPTTINEIVGVGDLPGINNYIPTTDYVKGPGNNISWAPGWSEPTLGDSFYVTFTETRAASAFTPILYFDENLIYEDHGEKTRTNGAINDVAVGGFEALNAGSKGVIIAHLNLNSAVDPDSPTNQELENAFIAMRDELNKITDYKLFLVPMSSGTIFSTTAAAIFFNHAVLCSQPEKKQERTCIAALEKDTGYAAAATFALTYSHERMVVPYAYDSISIPTGFTTEYDMRFANAALAGKLCSVGIGIEIADEITPNFTIKDNHTPEEFTYLVQRGVSPFKMRGDVVRIIMAITTDTTSALTESLGVQDVKDYVKKYWREGLWKVYKNKPITPALIQQIKASSENILGYLQSESIISDWQNITATQDTVEPRQVNVTGRIKPAFGLTWMDVTFTFVLSM